MESASKLHPQANINLILSVTGSRLELPTIMADLEWPSADTCGRWEMATYSNSARVLQPLSFRNLNSHYVNRKHLSWSLLQLFMQVSLRRIGHLHLKILLKWILMGESTHSMKPAGGYCVELQRRNVTSAIVITHPPEAKLQALFQWVNISWRKGFNRVILKGDCLILVENRVNSGRRLSYPSREFEDGNLSWDFMLTWKKLLNRLKVF